MNWYIMLQYSQVCYYSSPLGGSFVTVNNNEIEMFFRYLGLEAIK